MIVEYYETCPTCRGTGKRTPLHMPLEGEALDMEPCLACRVRNPIDNTYEASGIIRRQSHDMERTDVIAFLKTLPKEKT